MQHKHFNTLHATRFWKRSAYATKQYVSEPLTNALIASIEKELGYTLPQSYIALMHTQNGGIPFNTCFPTKKPTSWSEDHIAINGIYGIGRTKPQSVCGSRGSQFMIDEWGYPPIGVYICDCPSAGHDMVALDYRACGNNGEPEVVHVDQENDYKITFLAKNFEAFITGLVDQTSYDTAHADTEKHMKKVQTGPFSELLEDMCKAATAFPAMEAIIRDIATTIVRQKGYFVLHADQRSYFLYDVLFFLYEQLHGVESKEEYLKIYPHIIVFHGGFATEGYAPSRIEKWFDARIEQGKIKKRGNRFTFSKEYSRNLNKRLAEFSVWAGRNVAGGS